MRISTKGKHAVVAMVDLARNSKGKPVSLGEIALRQDISVSYLEQLISCLKEAGFVTSARGPGGGYMLCGRQTKTTIAEIVLAVDAPPEKVRLTDPLTANERQLTDVLWQDVESEVYSFLRRVTVADVINNASDSVAQVSTEQK